MEAKVQIRLPLSSNGDNGIPKGTTTMQMDIVGNSFRRLGPVGSFTGLTVYRGFLCPMSISADAGAIMPEIIAKQYKHLRTLILGRGEIACQSPRQLRCVM